MEEIKLKGIKEGAVRDIRLMIADFKVCLCDRGKYNE